VEETMNRSRIWFVLCAGIFTVSWIAASPSLAETKPTGQKPTTTAQPTATETEVIPSAEPGKVKELAEKAGVAPAKVASMRTSGMGWGEIKIAISLAQKISTAETTALPIAPILDSLLAQRQTGMGWGQIARENGFKLGEIVGKGQAKKDATVAPTETAPTDPATITGAKPEGGTKIEKVEKFGKPEKLDKPERLEKPEKPVRPEKPERPEKPQRSTK